MLMTLIFSSSFHLNAIEIVFENKRKKTNEMSTKHTMEMEELYAVIFNKIVFN